METSQVVDLENILVVAESDYFLPAGNENGIWTYVLEVFSLDKATGEIIEKISADEVDGTPYLDKPTPFYLTREEIESWELEEGREARDMANVPEPARAGLTKQVINCGEWGLMKLEANS